jgi:hypothetical protein
MTEKVFHLLERLIRFLLLLILCSGDLLPAQSRNSPSQDASKLIDHIMQHINFLASDELQGRGTGTEGERLAAEYIVQTLKNYGIQPAGENQTYFQNIPMIGSRPLASSKMTLFYRDSIHDLTLNNDYLLYKSGAQTYIPAALPLVFVGYGIIAPEYDYNDYQAVDVSGKIVVCLQGEPQYDDPDYFDGPNPTIYSYAESKQRQAISQGALGTIIIPHPTLLDRENWEQKKREFSSEDVTLAYRATGHLGVLMHSAAAQKLFRDAPVSYEYLAELDQRHALYSFELPVKLSFRGQFREREFIARNIAAFLPGKDAILRDTYLLISSHYDHLGIGLAVDGDSIYNGLVDNALGVAGVLELARLLHTSAEAPRRSILFLFLTGEEKGLLGSRYYIDNPLVPLYKTIANINIDGLAIFDRFTEVVGLGSDYSTLGEILEAVARLNGYRAMPVPSPFLYFESFSRSDQFAFAHGGIPGILISDGLGYENLTPREGLNKWLDWQDNYYHSPFDDLNQPISFPAVQQHVEFIFDFISRLSRMDQQPQWKSGVPFRTYQLRVIAEQR